MVVGLVILALSQKDLGFKASQDFIGRCVLGRGGEQNKTKIQPNHHKKPKIKHSILLCIGKIVWALNGLQLR